MKTKRTHSQERILKLLKNQKRSLSAQDIYLKLRRYDRPLGLATIYRSLDALKQEGVVIVRILASGESVYSYLQQDQHYLNCVKCGTSIPIKKFPIHDLENKRQRISSAQDLLIWDIEEWTRRHEMETRKKFSQSLPPSWGNDAAIMEVSRQIQFLRGHILVEAV